MPRRLCSVTLALLLSAPVGAGSLAHAQTRSNSPLTLAEHLDRGYALIEAGRLAAAESSFRQAERQARQSGAPDALGDVYAGRAQLAYARAQMSRALTLFDSARALYHRAGFDSSEVEALSNSGAVFTARDQPDSALGRYRLALALARDHHLTSSEGGILNNIGAVAQSLGQLDSAAYYADSALTMARRLADSATMSTAYNNLGLVFDERSRYARGGAALSQLELARAYYDSSLRSMRDRRSLDAASTLSNIGVLHRRAFTYGAPGSELDSALIYYRRAEILQRALQDERGRAHTLQNTGIVWSDRRRVDSALVYLRRALALHRRTHDTWWTYLALAEIARVYRRGSGLALSRAVSYYDSAAATLRDVAMRTGDDAERVSFAEQRSALELYEEWALTWLAREPDIGAARARLSALAAAERGRAQSLLLLIKQSGGSSDVTQARHSVEWEGEAIRRGVARLGVPALSYLQAGDTIVVWWLLPSGTVDVVRSAVGGEVLAQLVDSLQAALGIRRLAATAPIPDSSAVAERGLKVKGRPEEFRRIMRALSALLLPAAVRERLATDSAELLIIPQGQLAVVPFAALSLGGDDSLLVDRHAVRYAPSLNTALLLNQSSPPRRRTAETALVVGDPATPLLATTTGAEYFPRLPNAREEAASVGKLFHVVPLMDEAATEAAVRRALPTADIVHLATHGVSYTGADSARTSFIALAPGEGKDGFLTVQELLTEVPPLHADLVTLSACETGIGEATSAEGIVGLQRALLARGARSVLASLWSVNDASTAYLMKKFYSHWREDGDRPSKAQALRRAQLEMWHGDMEWSSPMAWAGFELVGGR